MRFEGIYTPVVTPHHDDGAINHEAFAQLVEFLIASGVHGLIVAGTTGEYYAQTPEERLDLMARARDIIA
ncbi:MAG: dihydrodipicolinate synthase family protein, partial [Pseudomonadota bacterium]